MCRFSMNRTKEEIITIGNYRFCILSHCRYTKDELLKLYWINHPRFRFVKFLPLNAKLLDVGAGSGGLIHWLEWENPKRNDIKMYAVDHVYGEYFDKYTDFHLCNLEKDIIKFDDSYFDGIIVSHVIEHISQEHRLLEEIRRLLKIGGRLYIECPTPETLHLPGAKEFKLLFGVDITTVNFKDDLTHLRTFELDQLHRLVADHGFRVLESGIIENKYLEDELFTFGVYNRDSVAIECAVWSKLRFAEYIISEREI